MRLFFRSHLSVFIKSRSFEKLELEIRKYLLLSRLFSWRKEMVNCLLDSGELIT